MIRNGLDPEKEKLMQTTAYEAEWKEKKRRTLEEEGVCLWGRMATIQGYNR